MQLPPKMFYFHFYMQIVIIPCSVRSITMTSTNNARVACQRRTPMTSVPFRPQGRPHPTAAPSRPFCPQHQRPSTAPSPPFPRLREDAGTPLRPAANAPSKHPAGRPPSTSVQARAGAPPARRSI